jgi:hypothetical protein
MKSKIEAGVLPHLTNLFPASGIQALPVLSFRSRTAKLHGDWTPWGPFSSLNQLSAAPDPNLALETLAKQPRTQLSTAMLSSAFNNSKSGLCSDESGYTANRTRRTTVARSESAGQSTLDRPNGGSQLTQHWICLNRDEEEARFQQHKQLGSQLQRENALAAQAWLTLRRSGQGQKRYKHVCADLANNIVPRMNFLTGRCEQIANTTPAVFAKAEVHFGPFCGHCDRTARSADRSSLQLCIRTLEADPAWGVLVEYLLLHLTWTGGDCSSLNEFEESPRCLHSLIKALHRQQRHLAEMGIARTPKMIVDPNILVIFDNSEVCPECGNPTEYFSGPTTMPARQESTNETDIKVHSVWEDSWCLRNE